MILNKNIEQFPEDITFKYPWRSYQKRVLDELNIHLDDNHLHIIAPPGSGKTILGLEVILRLDKPVLILAPTVAIRNQWVQRFQELFLQTDILPYWISYDIKNPSFFTVATYQSLHVACTGVEVQYDEDDFEEETERKENRKRISPKKVQALLKKLIAQKVGTIVIDEAHHLKNAWWQSLIQIKRGLQATVVGLTATPPYDVSYTEWQRYIALNGPVDAEISVPELVLEGNLCPHQDYVFLSKPTKDESLELTKHRTKIKALFTTLQKDKTLQAALKNHPIYTNPEDHLEWIYTHLEYYSATLIYLNATGEIIDKKHLEVIGDKKLKLPKLDYHWLEIVLTFYLYEDAPNFINYKKHQEQLIYKLRRNSAIEKRNINFKKNHKINRLFNTSISKLDSIHTIVDFEYTNLKDKLRMVILTDYIRKEYLINNTENTLPLTKIGVMSIFEKIRRNNDKQLKIGVLSGSTVIIPVQANSCFQALLKQNNQDKIVNKPLEFDSDYLLIQVNSQLKQTIVKIITQLFEAGEIEVLIGTKSLLGEGWDAPAINSLILASFVGSYVLSNQMRGRAIRSQLNNKNKTGNIWHLVCLDESEKDGGADLQLLKRRFNAFVGVSREDDGIENGLDRLGVSFSEQALEEINKTMLVLAKDRKLLQSKWKNALKNGVSLVEEIKIPSPRNQNYSAQKQLYTRKTVLYLLATLSAGLTMYSETFISVFRRFGEITTTASLLRFLLFFGGGGVLFFGRLTYKSFRNYLKYRDVSKDIYQIGQTVLDSLIELELIKTPKKSLEIKVNIDKKGGVAIFLAGGSTFEKSVFISNLEETLSPIDNPRYIIIRKSHFINLIAQRDYHSVPEIIARKKSTARAFESAWRNYVGRCTLVYTRTVKGRKILLKSRLNSLAAQFDKKINRSNKWQ